MVDRPGSSIQRATALRLLFLLAWPGALAAQSLNGTVLEQGTDSPITQVNVTVDGSRSTVSDSAGAYRIDRLPPGPHTVVFTHIAYETATRTVEIEDSIRLDIALSPRVIGSRESVVSARRGQGDWAIERSSPVPHAALDVRHIERTRTTGDLPELAAAVPGAWSSSAGLGESELTLRGFASDRVSYFIDGLPMNEPEDREMNWADWAGLAGMVDAVQTVRGPSFIGESTGAFGGAVQFHTREPEAEAVRRFRISLGVFRTTGASKGDHEGAIATGGGTFESAGAIRHLVASFESHTGPVLGGRARFGFAVERKLGDSYIQGTHYDGIALSLRGVADLGAHELSFLFMGGPQEHQQAETLQDRDLLETLGREYSHVNHPWRTDRSWQFAASIRDRLALSDRHVLLADVYGTAGGRTGARLISGTFDTATGQVGYQPVSLGGDYAAFGRHALYLYERFGVLMRGYTGPLALVPEGLFNDHDIVPPTPAHLLTGQNTHSWQLGLHHDHRQVGLSAQLITRQTRRWEWLLGGSARVWFGHRAGEAEIFRLSDALTDGQATFVTDLQDAYSYDTRVSRLSLFGRTSVELTPIFSLHAGAQVMSIGKHVSEKPVDFFDFAADVSGRRYFPGRATLMSVRTSEDQVDPNGEPRFCSCQYEAHYAVASPWAGLLLSVDDLDLYANVALSYREPSIGDWYEPDRGPLDEDGVQELLEPERMRSLDLGIRERIAGAQVSFGYYRSVVDDRLESIVDELGRRQTLNAGGALYQGIEASLSASSGRWRGSGSAAMARNRWRRIDVEDLFGTAGHVVEGKVIPFAPERSANLRLDYERRRLGLGASLAWWDRYFGTYSNDYLDAQGRRRSSELPYFLDLGVHGSWRMTWAGAPVTLRLDVNNVLDRWENFQRARLAVDHTRNDALQGVPTWYVLQAPLRHAFLTLQAEL